MGLDMYLSVRQYEGDLAAAVEAYNNHDWNSTEDTPDIGEETGEVYWRKANAIHGWFVSNCQNGIDQCQLTYVPREKIQELFNLCVKVMENKGKASKLLPTTGGFFFGTYEYDDWYFDYVETTAKELYDLLQNPDNTQFTYQSSW